MEAKLLAKNAIQAIWASMGAGDSGAVVAQAISGIQAMLQQAGLKPCMALTILAGYHLQTYKQHSQPTYTVTFAGGEQEGE